MGIKTKTIILMRGSVKGVLIVFFLLGCFLWMLSITKRDSVRNAIRRIPVEDAHVLDHFFRALILEDTGGYVLFGKKPMTFTVQPQISLDSLSDAIYHSSNQWAIYRGLKVWEKYRFLFPMSNYVLNYAENEDRNIVVYLINKKNFFVAYRQHQSDFRAILGDEVSPAVLLKRLEKRPADFFSALNRHEALLGILLGFGRENAWLFHYRAHGWPGGHPLVVNPKPLTPFSSIEEERAYFASRSDYFCRPSERSCLFITQLPAFIADPEAPETTELKNEYKQQRRKIAQAYSNGNFLEVTLSRLCSFVEKIPA